MSLFFVAAAAASAQVPPDIAAQLRQIGPVVDPPGTAKLYRPLHPTAPYAGVTVVRDVSYGANPRQVLDVFAPAQGGGAARPVLIYVPGGAGNKTEAVPGGETFYDNIMLWAVKNGMTGVNMQRLGGQDRNWDDPARDVGIVVQWVQQNIGKYSGDPSRVFLWAHSAGNGPVGNYIAHAPTHGPKGVGVKGTILMSAGNMNLLPVTITNPGRAGRAGQGAPGAAGAAAAGAPGRGGNQPAVDPATQLARSNLPGLQKTAVALFVGAGEIDTPGAVAFVDGLKTELCKANRCPTTAIFKDHSHMSVVFSPNTADDSVTRPILQWMRSVK